MEQTNNIKIYALIDPRNEIVRYIGWTSKPLKRRLTDHISDSNRGHNNHRCKWIRKMLSQNVVPVIKTIEECDYNERWDRERYWISYYGRENLVNGTDGGEGVKGLTVTEESRNKMSVSHIGKTPWNKGVSTDTTHLVNFKFKKGHVPHNKGKNMSDEAKAKLSESKLGKHIGKKKKSKSAYLGITQSLKDKKWVAQIRHNKKTYNIGRYKSEEEAAIAYDICYFLWVNSSDNLNFKFLLDKYKKINFEKDLEIRQIRKIIKDFLNQEE